MQLRTSLDSKGSEQKGSSAELLPVFKLFDATSGCFANNYSGWILEQVRQCLRWIAVHNPPWQRLVPNPILYDHIPTSS